MARNKEFDPTERLEKAREVFREKGYHATSMQDLVDTMKLNRGSIYDTYGDKHALFLQCLAGYANETLKEYQDAAEGAASPLAAIEKIILKAVEKTLKEDNLCMVVKTSFELGPTDKSAHAIISKQGDALITTMETLVRQAQTMGLIDKNKDPHVFASFILASFGGFWQAMVMTKDPKLVNSLAALLIDLIKK